MKYLKDEIITSAEMELKEAKKHHFSLESIYSEAMVQISQINITVLSKKVLVNKDLF